MSVVSCNLIGEGAYGAVYKVRYNDNTYSAVKQSFVDNTTDFLGNIKEIDFLVRLKECPYVVKIKDITYHFPYAYTKTTYGNKNDSLFIIMEYIPYTLESFIFKYHDPFKIKRYICQALMGLEYMHKNEIIHRDIKPGNILWDNTTQTIKFCDFGLSRNNDRLRDTSPGVVTYCYRAPEIVCNFEYNEKSDIWSLGVVLFEMITKRYMFELNDDDPAKIKLLHSELLDIDRNKLLKLMGTIYLPENDAYPLIDLLVNMLQLDPYKRYTAEQCLNMHVFDEYRNEIEQLRSRINLSFNKTKRTINCMNRKHGIYFAMSLYQNRKKYPWYKHRMLFTAIDLFDKWINYIGEDFKLLSKVMSELLFCICFYVSVKYHVSLCRIPKFNELCDFNKLSFTDKDIEIMSITEKHMYTCVQMLEYKLLNDVLNYRIYDKNALSGDERNVVILLRRMLNVENVYTV